MDTSAKGFPKVTYSVANATGAIQNSGQSQLTFSQESFLEVMARDDF